jgi:hypothetical protein
VLNNDAVAAKRKDLRIILRIFRQRRRQNVRQVDGKFRARHHFIESRHLRLRGKASLHVGQKSYDPEIRLHTAQLLYRGQRLRTRVQIDNDQLGGRIEQLQQRFCSRGNFHFQTEMLGGFRQLHLEK